MQYHLPGALSCSEHFSRERSLGRKDFGIYDHLWVGLFTGLWDSPPPHPHPVYLHEGGIAGPDYGNNPTGNWAALSKIHFSHLLQTKISVPHCSSQNDHERPMGLSDSNPLLLC